MTATKTASDTAPERQLGTRERVKSPDDVDRVLEELAFIESIEKTCNARTTQRCSLIKQEEAKRLFLKVGEKEVSFADRREQLESKITEYVIELGESFFPPGMKTRAFTFGEISSKVQPEKVAYIDGATPKTVMERIEKKTGLIAKILEFLDKLKIFGVPLARLVKVEPALDLNAAKAALKNGEIKEGEFRSLGIEVVRPPEKLYIKPYEYFVQSEGSK